MKGTDYRIYGSKGKKQLFGEKVIYDDEPGMSDKERVSGGGPDSFKLLHQAERISRVFASQMEGLLEELERTEIQITKCRFVCRCINRLDAEDRNVIEQFIRKSVSYEEGMDILHVGRTSVYRLQKKAIDNLLELYRKGQE